MVHSGLKKLSYRVMFDGESRVGLSSTSLPSKLAEDIPSKALDE